MAMAEQTVTNDSAGRKRRRGKDRRFELGPHSAWFRRGSTALLNGNSREAKFVKTFEKAILDHLGGADRATVPQRLYAARLAKIALRLELFDRRLLVEDGALTDHDSKVYAALHSAFRLMLRDLGLKASAQHTGPTLAEMLAQDATQ